MKLDLSRTAATVSVPRLHRPGHQTGTRWPYLGLIGVCAAALAVRLPAVNFGLPALVHPDEPANVAVGVSLADHHTVNPHHFSYPSLLYDIIAFVRLLGRVFAGHRTPVVDLAQNVGTGRTTDPLLFTELRLVMVTFSVAICVLVWLTVRWITGNLWAAGFAGLAGALSPILVTNGVYITPDTLSAFFAAVGLAGALLIYRNGRRFDYLVAGLGVGLSAGAKYNAVAVAIAPVVAHLARYRRGSLRFLDRLVLTGVVSVVMFVVVTPTALLHTHEFLTGALKELHHYQTGHPGVTGSSFGFYMSTLRHDSILWLVGALLAVGGLVGRWKTESLIVGVYGVLYLVLVSSQIVHFDRNILPLLPALLLLTGFGFATLYETVSAGQTIRTYRSRAGAVSLAVVGALALVFPAISSAKVASKLSDRPLSEARAWLEARIPSGSEIVVEAYGPWMPPGLFKVVPRTFVVSGSPPPTGAAAVIVDQSGSGRFLAAPSAYRTEVAAYRAFTRQWCLAKQFTDGAWLRIFVPCT